MCLSCHGCMRCALLLATAILTLGNISHRYRAQSTAHWLIVLSFTRLDVIQSMHLIFKRLDQQLFCCCHLPLAFVSFIMCHILTLWSWSTSDNRLIVRRMLSTRNSWVFAMSRLHALQREHLSLSLLLAVLLLGNITDGERAQSTAM